MFYKRRDYTRIVNGRNPIVAHEFLGTSVEGKDMIIIDDMISSGESMLEVAAALKERKANKIFVFSTFGLFTNGLDKFDKAYENGIIDKVLTTNLIYQTPELLQREWYINCDMSKYIAYIIDTLNHDSSISDLLNPNERIQNIVANIRRVSCKAHPSYINLRVSKEMLSNPRSPWQGIRNAARSYFSTMRSCRRA